MRFASFTSVALAAAGLVAGSVIPREAHLEARADATCTNYCAGTNQTADARWVCGDIRLGPTILPFLGSVAELLVDYHRFGGLCPGDWLKAWFNTTSGFFNYPQQAGFSLTTSGSPIAGNLTLPVGSHIDRFGSEFGTFLAPAGTPYAMRAIPPQSLSVANASAAPPYNYYEYEVLKPFIVLAGPIAPWFTQPGQGTQYEAYDRVNNLIAQGYLRRLNSDEQ